METKETKQRFETRKLVFAAVSIALATVISVAVKLPSLPPCLSDSDLILSNAVKSISFPISAPTLSLLTCGFSAIAPC